jgi:AcrR family transcriptional regulator
MSNDDVTTRARILDATVKLLLKTAPGELTTRRIATAAEVNVAAINYHFRSKDELVNRAMESATAQAFEKGLTVLLAAGRRPRDRLGDFLTGYAFGLVEFPGLTKTAFLGLFRQDDSKTFYGRYLREMLDKVALVVGEVRGSADRRANTDLALRAIACVVFPFLLPDTLREAGAVDYADDDERRRYIEATLTGLLGSSTREKRHG